MEPEKILQLLDKQDRAYIHSAKVSLPDMMEKEFVMTNILKKFIEYILKKENLDYHLYNMSIPEQLSRRDILIKKTNGFQISKHTHEFAMYLHKHTYIEMDYVYKGSCMYYINSAQNAFRLKEKELCIVNQNVIHGIDTDSKEDIVFKCFFPFEYFNRHDFTGPAVPQSLKDFFTNSFNADGQYAVYLVVNTSSNPNMENILFQIFSEQFEKQPDWKQAFDDYASLFLTELMRIQEKNYVLSSKLISDDIRFENLLLSIEKNYQYVTLKDLAKDFHFHENYLSRKIKKETGSSFNDLIRHYRFLEAENLLLHSNLTVEDIAERIGYDTPGYFYKLFKKYYKMTPMDFRSRTKEL